MWQRSEKGPTDSNRFRVEANARKPQIAYKETVLVPADGEERLVNSPGIAANTTTSFSKSPQPTRQRNHHPRSAAAVLSPASSGPSPTVGSTHGAHYACVGGQAQHFTSMGCFFASPRIRLGLDAELARDLCKVQTALAVREPDFAERLVVDHDLAFLPHLAQDVGERERLAGTTHRKLLKNLRSTKRDFQTG